MRIVHFAVKQCAIFRIDVHNFTNRKRADRKFMLVVSIITKAENQDYGRLILLKLESKPVAAAGGL